MTYEDNKELAEWAGLKFTDASVPTIVKHPDGYYSVCPNFTESLDACFKWLVPKIIKDGNYSIIITQDIAGCTAYVRPLQSGRQYDATDNRSPALALCRAVLKVIR